MWAGPAHPLEQPEGVRGSLEADQIIAAILRWPEDEIEARRIGLRAPDDVGRETRSVAADDDAAAARLFHHRSHAPAEIALRLIVQARAKRRASPKHRRARCGRES